MAKAVARRRRNGVKGMTIPVALMVGFLPITLEAINGAQRGGWKGMAHQVAYSFTGWDTDTRTWEQSRLKGGLYPVLIGMGVHWIADKMGVNRALQRAKMPILRI